MIQRQEHIAPGALRFARDRASDPIARGQIAHRIHSGHERVAIRVHDARALAAQRLRQQEPRLPGTWSAVG